MLDNCTTSNLTPWHQPHLTPFGACDPRWVQQPLLSHMPLAPAAAAAMLLDPLAGVSCLSAAASASDPALLLQHPPLLLPLALPAAPLHLLRQLPPLLPLQVLLLPSQLTRVAQLLQLPLLLPLLLQLPLLSGHSQPSLSST
jgi:hypothetical protein